ncbi:MAG TPA: hypothetical protein VJ873_02935, partial [bacterium]|nr:hypothetical protein [bacterium]
MRRIKKIVLILLGLGCLVYLSLLVMIEAFYRDGLNPIEKPFPLPTEMKYSARIQAAVWYGSGEIGKVKVAPLMPWTIFWDYADYLYRTYPVRNIR